MLPIVIFGPVGVGKSTIVQTLGKRIADALVISEPVDALISSGALDAVYQNRPGSALTLQMLVLSERIASYWRAMAVAANTKPGVIIMDGYYDLDLHIFCDEHMRAERLTASERQCMQTAEEMISSAELVPRQLRNPVLYFYLTASALTCAVRSDIRGRTEETALDISWFERNCKDCDAVARSLIPRTKLVTIDAEIHLDRVVNMILDVISTIRKNSGQ